MQYTHPDHSGIAAVQSYLSADCKSMKYRVRSERQFDAMGQEIAYFNDGDRAPVKQSHISSNPIARLKCRKHGWQKGEHGTDEVICMGDVTSH